MICGNLPILRASNNYALVAQLSLVFMFFTIFIIMMLDHLQQSTPFWVLKWIMHIHIIFFFIFNDIT